ncbi:MAG: hypothetical protein JWM85_1060 [Acidimicrobiaceae bacterium]|nr:hypothetical protein [Acidimicrobiaceae bacterium]
MSGKDLRQSVARRDHESWAPRSDRDPIRILQEQNARRIPELVPLRIARMIESPFAYYRGAAAVMASDLSTTPVTSIEVHASGDAHLLNFGLFGSPERTLLFDLNDFDETLFAPWEWDVKRLAASATVAARQNGLDDFDAAEITRAGVRSYRQRMAAFAQMAALDVFYSRVEAEKALSLSKVASPGVRKQLDKARQNTSSRVISKLTFTSAEGAPRIIDQPPFLSHSRELESEELIGRFFETYRSTVRNDVQLLLQTFRLVDVARKVVGVGSVGTRCYIALLLDRRDAPLFLQIKEAERSVLEPHWKRTIVERQGERVVQGQRIMQAASDVFLGWASDEEGRDFYVRQLKDMKGAVDVASLSAPALREYLELCGWTLARAHAQSGAAREISEYLGSGDPFDEAITTFAKSYADQNSLDYQALVDAVRAGNIAAMTA